MHIKVSYPSGNELTFEGRWIGPMKINDVDDTVDGVIATVLSGFRIGTEYLNRGTVFLGDPRGVYRVIDTGEVLYQPRDECVVPYHAEWVTEWLEENPDWPGVLEI